MASKGCKTCLYERKTRKNIVEQLTKVGFKTIHAPRLHDACICGYLSDPPTKDKKIIIY